MGDGTKEDKMAFPTQDPRSYNRDRVEKITPGQKGCYGLSRGDTWVYVGKGDIRDRLLDHLNGDNPCITREKPTHWVDVVTDDMDAREKALIRELGPICNERIG